MMALGFAAIAILVVIGLALVRAFLGPTIYDRVLAVNMVGTKTVLLICVIDFLGGNSDFLDVALVYTLINFIGVIAMLKFYADDGQGEDADLCPGHNMGGGDPR
jgi:multicomponent Na+:H+ antiporter subunit F